MKTFKSKFGRPLPITGQQNFKPPAKIGGATAMDDGSTGQAEEQIAASPMPLQNPRSVANLPAPANQEFGRRQVQGSSAGGTRPRAHTAAAPRSAPISQGQANVRVGYAPNYAAGYGPSTHPTAKARVIRGAAPKGSKPLYNSPPGQDFTDYLKDGITAYHKQHGRL